MYFWADVGTATLAEVPIRNCVLTRYCVSKPWPEPYPAPAPSNNRELVKA